MEPRDELRRFYENEGREEHRLAPNSIQHLEFLTAVRYLDRHLPKNSKVLDSCAGSGVYAYHLARQGHAVTAGDLIPYNVERILASRGDAPALAAVHQLDAANLSRFEDASFDAVLCMGALYHLLNEADREKAVAESLRVLRPGGVFAATYMNRYAVILNNLTPELENLDDMLQFSKRGVEGIFYASTPEEMKGLMADFGVEKLCHIPLDGMAFFLVHTAGLVQPSAFERWKEYHFAVCEDESNLGSSYHCIFIGRKPAPPTAL